MDTKVIELINQYPNDMELGNALRRMWWRESNEGVKIYESPDKGKTVYSRNIGESQRTLIKDEGEI